MLLIISANLGAGGGSTPGVAGADERVVIEPELSGRYEVIRHALCHVICHVICRLVVVGGGGDGARPRRACHHVPQSTVSRLRDLRGVTVT